MKFLTFIAILALIWAIGLFAFAERVRGYTPAPEPARADAIVALTGPSAERRGSRPPCRWRGATC